MRRRCFTVLLLACLAFVLTLRGGFDPTSIPVFENANHPDRTEEVYLRGDLGIVKPSFRHVYLFIAYRHLSGVGFGEEALQSMLGLDSEAQRFPSGGGWESWQNARARYGRTDTTRLAPASPYRVPSVGDTWRQFLNCTNDAFGTAVVTLRRRSNQFGRDSSEVAGWLAAQDVVFSNCSGGAEIPPSVPPGTHMLIRMDRDYQIAAAYFYSEQYVEAARRFEAIGRDRGSPWSDWGLYLAARSHLRKGMLLAESGRFNAGDLEEAGRRFQAVLDDARLAERHASARGLLEFVQMRTAGNERIAELGARLQSGGLGAATAENWRTFDWLVDNGFGEESRQDLTAWLREFRKSEHSVEEWRAKRSLPWLVAALHESWQSGVAPSDVMEAAQRVPSDSPGYLTVLYYRLQIELGQGRREEVRRELDRILAVIGQTDDVTINQFRGMRLKLARDLVDLVQVAPRTMVRTKISPAFMSPGRLPILGMGMDDDFVGLFNRGLTLERMAEIAESGALPRSIAAQVLAATWVRAGLLGKREQAAAAGEALAQAWEPLRPYVEDYAKTPDSASGAFALTFALLHNPGLRPHLVIARDWSPTVDLEAYRSQNWWCAQAAPGQQTIADIPTFLGATERAQAAEEVEALRRIPAAPNYFAEVVMDWAIAHPNDSRVPEALHLTVARATRYGCRDDATTSHSQRAFQLLHRQYRNSEWAKKTPYWY